MLARALVNLMGFRPTPPMADKAALDAARDRLATKSCEIVKDVDEMTRMVRRLKRMNKKRESGRR